MYIILRAVGVVEVDNKFDIIDIWSDNLDNIQIIHMQIQSLFSILFLVYK